MRFVAAWTVLVWMTLVPTLSPAQTIDHHGAPAVACSIDGGFIVVWQSRGQDGDGYGIIAQRFDSSGGYRGTEFIVNTYTTDNQLAPVVCSDDQSRFVVVWQSYGQDDDGDGIFARMFDGNGDPRASEEFQVPNSSSYGQLEADAACSSVGDFVIVWSGGNQDAYGGYDIFARRFTSAGNSSAGEFRVNANTSDSQITPAVAVDATGGFVVTWTSYDDQDGDGYGVFAQRFGSDGSALGSEMQINTYATSNQLAPAVAADTTGGFVVAWSSSQTIDPGYDVFSQRFSSTGVLDGSELQINTYTIGDQGVSLGTGGVAVARSSDDNYVVVWQSQTLPPPSQDGDGIGVYAQRIGGSPPALVGSEFRVNSTTSGDQAYPSVCATGAGSFVVAWENRGSTDAIFAQRFDSNGAPLGPEIRVSSDTARGAGPCPGDCDGSRLVTVNELVTGVNIALTRRPVADCPAFDADINGTVTVNELVAAVRAAIEGCPPPQTPTPAFTPTPLVPDRTRRSA